MAEEIRFDDVMHCVLIQSQATDAIIVHAARVSTGKDEPLTGCTSGQRIIDGDAGLINFLMKNRHGTPFEHGMLTFRVTVPIFVMRELHRHRIGMSYNEQSGRYMELAPHFYVPPRLRPLVQQGKPGHYEFVAGTDDHFAYADGNIRDVSRFAWERYQMTMDAGVAKEVARMVLPVNIYSSCYVTCNPRSLMHFLSLRTKDEQAAYPSFPMHEIERLADKMEWNFARLMPVTHEAFCKNGRLAP